MQGMVTVDFVVPSKAGVRTFSMKSCFSRKQPGRQTDTQSGRRAAAAEHEVLGGQQSQLFHYVLPSDNELMTKELSVNY